MVVRLTEESATHFDWLNGDVRTLLLDVPQGVLTTRRAGHIVAFRGKKLNAHALGESIVIGEQYSAHVLPLPSFNPPNGAALWGGNAPSVPPGREVSRELRSIRPVTVAKHPNPGVVPSASAGRTILCPFAVVDLR